MAYASKHYGQSQLAREGLTNYSSEDYAAYTTGRVVLGYCTSFKCCAMQSKRVVKKGKYMGKEVNVTSYRPKVLKTSNTSVEKCPDCGATLLWR